jgi:glycerol-3-phosphate dehydrogenase (NAD(P)+)
VHWIGRTIGPHLSSGQMVIAITKGLEADANGDLTILPDVLKAELPAGIRERVPLAAIGGPCIAGELAGRRQTCVVFGSRDGGVVERLATAFRTPYYHVWTTTDLVGLEYCAAMKNAYTVGVALAYGALQKAGGTDAAGAHMHNLAAALFGQACTEMARILEVVGATRSFAFGLPGAGDMFVTCVGGRTIRLGTLLGKGHSMAEAREMLAGLTLEGAEIIRNMGRAIPRLVAQGTLGATELPLLRLLVDIVAHGRPAEILLDRFFGGAARV